MHNMNNSISFSGLWSENPPLTLSSLVMALAVPILLIALVADPRLLEGQPLWMKPLKFAVSIALYCFTLQLILRFLQGGSERQQRAVRWISWGVAALFLVEVLAIFGQAARGRVSHFNNETPEDALIFGTMGTAVMGLFILHLILSWFLIKQESSELVIGSGLRTGLFISLLGMAAAYPMVTPTAENIAAFERGEQPTRVGAHTVGAPDGGPGMPVTGWSSEAGDLRIAHFVGLHGMQILPLFAFWQRRRYGNTASARTGVRLAALSYTLFTVALCVQALRGQALLQADLFTAGLLAIALAIGALAAFWPARRQSRVPASELTGEV